jgi:hypothetical protein
MGETNKQQSKKLLMLLFSIVGGYSDADYNTKQSAT